MRAAVLRWLDSGILRPLPAALRNTKRGQNKCFSLGLERAGPTGSGEAGADPVVTLGVGVKQERRKTDKGRWMVERERCQIGDAFPPKESREPVPLAVGISDFIRALDTPERALLQELAAGWKTLAAAPYAQHTRPAEFGNGVLTVCVDSSVWLSELSRYGKKALLASLQSRYGVSRIRSLRLQVDTRRD